MMLPLNFSALCNRLEKLGNGENWHSTVVSFRCFLFKFLLKEQKMPKGKGVVSGKREDGTEKYLSAPVNYPVDMIPSHQT